MRVMVAGAERQANRELLCNRYRISVWEDEKNLEMDGGDTCTTV
jgi:hypothetical protein